MKININITALRTTLILISILFTFCKKDEPAPIQTVNYDIDIEEISQVSITPLPLGWCPHQTINEQNKSLNCGEEFSNNGRKRGS